ncbi:hypothetical protein CgunFtcFv8_023226 [Champsocephalus gunnari]|uniref:Uncharacterized protein n=1 Tax=Champsocephalus gunnari TaxID=52237 RepID=A0AAN8DEA2_CHAGU|nr:hypothetical protein CgunFtcFv8_023226 [Champsocephalus gunnari]
MRQSATLTPLLVQREAGQAQADSRSNILRAEKQEVPGETRGTGIPNHSPQSSHHHNPPPTLNSPSFLSPPALQPPPQTHRVLPPTCSSPPILSQRKSPVVFPVAMFYLFTRALLQERGEKKMKAK